MYFILGGRAQGKLEYAKQIYGNELRSYDLKEGDMETAFSYEIIYNIHEWVKKMLILEKSPTLYFKNNLSKFENKIIIGDEIGSGIVPIDAFERTWRDETGWLYQLISQHSKRVNRVFAGLGITLKDMKVT